MTAHQYTPNSWSDGDEITEVKLDRLEAAAAAALPVEDAAAVALSGSYADLTGKPTIPSDAALRAEFLPFWTANEVLIAGAIRVAPDGTTIQRNANGTARSSYDGTEAALWTVRGGGGGTATTDAGALTTGILPAARIADASIADAKLAAGTALTPAERTKLTGIATAATANRTDAATDTLLAGKAPLASPAFTGTPTGITKAHVGLGNVDNTADTAKPVSTAQAAAIAAKAPLLPPTATKTGPYTAAAGELAVMDVPNGGNALTLPAAPADGDRVAFWAIGATTAVPLVVTRGGTATLGSSGATSVTVPLAGELTTYQYQATGTRWVPVANTKPLAALDGRYLLNTDAPALIRSTIGAALVAGTSNVTVTYSSSTGATVIGVAGEGSFRTMSDRQRIPVLTKLTPTVATRSQVGLTTIYVPWMIRVPDAAYQAYPALGRFRIYTSTDHDVGDGGIAVLTTQATDPTATDTVWTPYRTSPGGLASIFADGTNRQTETPCVVYEPTDPAGKPFRMYYQVAVGTTQTTRVARSADGVTNWEIIGDAIPNFPQAVAGWNHTGYARVWFIDGLWCAFHLMGSGVGTSDYGWSYSYDGLSFITDRAAMTADLQDTDGVLRLGLNGLFEFRGQLWAIGRQTEYTSGPVSSTVANIYTAPINDDLRSFKGRPQLLSWPLISGELSDNPPGVPTTWVTLDDGRLVGAYRVSAANASGDYMRLAVLS